MIRLILLALGLSVFSGAFACRSAPQYSPEAVGALAKDAAYVIEATLASTASKTSGRFTVHRWLKGNGPSNIDIAGFGYGTDCRSPMEHERALLFLSKSVDGTFVLREVEVYAGVRPATRDNIQAIMIAVAASVAGPKSNE
jgi:hypothetical protein